MGFAAHPQAIFNNNIGVVSTKAPWNILPLARGLLVNPRLVSLGTSDLGVCIDAPARLSLVKQNPVEW